MGRCINDFERGVELVINPQGHILVVSCRSSYTPFLRVLLLVLLIKITDVRTKDRAIVIPAHPVVLEVTTSSTTC